MKKYDLEETTRRFHNIYEKVAKEYGYKTREDTKELDFNSPNGMTMLKTVEIITTPYLEEIERLRSIVKEGRKTLIKSKEYIAVKSLNFNRKQSVLIELEEILDKVDKDSDKE